MTIFEDITINDLEGFIKFIDSKTGLIASITLKDNGKYKISLEGISEVELECYFNCNEVLNKAREEKYKELSKACRKEIFGGFYLNDLHYGYNILDQTNLSHILQAIIIDPTYQVYYKDEDSPFPVPYTHEEIKEVFQAGLDHKAQCCMKLYNLIFTVQQANTLEEIINISW